MIKYLKKSLIIFSVSLFWIETTSFIAFKSGILKDFYSLRGVTKPIHIRNQGTEWRTANLSYGAWHKKNATTRHTKACFDVIYKSNNIGARDEIDYGDSFPKDSIVALGDSFMEGYGLNQSETITTILEKKSSRKIFNLASAGHFGPLQYYLIYKKLGATLPHNTVIIGFLPSNDFTDNDSNNINRIGNKIYRPYYDINNFEIDNPLIYPPNAEKTTRIGRYGLKKFLAAQAIRTNTRRLYKNIVLMKKYKIDNLKGDGGFYNMPSFKQQEAAIYYLKKTYELAIKNNVKNFIIIGIPIMEDFDFLKDKYTLRKKAKWEKELIDFEKINKSFKYIDGFKVLDLLKEQNLAPQKLFLSCDGHWSPVGALLNAELINSNL